MAAPPEKTLGNLTGQWVMNKTLSDDTDSILALQGVSWFTRKAISLATVTLHTKQYVDPATNHTHIDIEQVATGGIRGTTELRELDWEEREHQDHIFGMVKGKSRWLGLDKVEEAFLKEGWLDEPAAGPNGEKFIESWATNEKAGWTADQIWGFATIDGKRYYVRRVLVKKGDTTLKARLVYNWSG